MSMCAAATIAVASAMPSAAASGTVAFVNGIPGHQVDVCVDGKEVRSRLPYGAWTARSMAAGPKRLRVRSAGRGTCKGAVLASRNFVLAEGPDLTIVATRDAPRILVFENFGSIPPTGPPFDFPITVLRHAADLGAVNVHVWQAEEILVTTALDPVWTKGTSSDPMDGFSGTRMGADATRPEMAAPIVDSRTVQLAVSRRYEWYLLGTNRKNAKFIVFSRFVTDS